MNSVTKKQLIISIIFNGINTLQFIYYLFEEIKYPSYLFYLTIWVYNVNCIFLLLCLICDCANYFHNEGTNFKNVEDILDYKELALRKDSTFVAGEKEYWAEGLNDWNRNIFGTYCNTFSYFVCFSFWILFFSNYISVSRYIYDFLGTVYQHLTITIIIIIDIFTAERKMISFSKNSLGIIISIYFIYCIFAYILTFSFNKNVYSFMKTSSFPFLIFYLIISSGGLGLCYILHVWMVRYANQ